MIRHIELTIFLLLIGTLSASSKSDDEVITVPSTDIPSDGRGLVPEKSPPHHNTSIVVGEAEDASRISKIYGFLYNYSFGPAIDLVLYLLKPFIFLIKWTTKPIAGIIDRILHFVGLPSSGDIISQLIIQGEKIVTDIVANISSFIQLFLGRQNLKTRSKRSITDTMMAPIKMPFNMAYNIVTFPYRMIVRIYNIITAPFRKLYHMIMWPINKGYRATTFPIRVVGRVLGVSRDKSSSSESNSSNSGITDNGNSTAVRSNAQSNDQSNSPSIFDFRQIISDLFGIFNNGVQDTLATILSEGFKYLKSDILPFLDKTLSENRDSPLIPKFLRPYIDFFHQFYSVLHLFGIL